MKTAALIFVLSFATSALARPHESDEYIDNNLNDLPYEEASHSEEITDYLEMWVDWRLARRERDNRTKSFPPQNFPAEKEHLLSIGANWSRVQSFRNASAKSWVGAWVGFFWCKSIKSQENFHEFKSKNFHLHRITTSRRTQLWNTARVLRQL